MDPTQRELLWLRRVRDLSSRLASRRDVGRLFEDILDAAIELTEAERGFVVRVELLADGGQHVQIKAARGFDRAALTGSSGDVSRTVVERVLARDAGLVTSSEDADVLDASSVQARRVRSILCVPMRLRDELRGVLYLDHRFTHGAFSEADLPIAATFADQAALALETAELEADRDRARTRLGSALAELEQLQARVAEADARPDDDPAHLLDPSTTCFGGLVGASEAMRELYHQIERAARSWAPVLILGESGSGKELVARELHQRSHPQEPFLSENCAALSGELLASEFLGHVQGSFTGATQDRAGLFLEAGAGTLLLDEVGGMPLELQAVLLRVLQEGQVRPLGGEQTREVRCRVVAATHQDLRSLVDERRFREDLYYRLDVLRLAVPPLRQRRDDIPLLIEHFAREEGQRLRLTAAATELLVAYSWPGNVRELRNEIRRLLSTAPSGKVGPALLSPEIREGRGVSLAAGGNAGKTLAEVEREMIVAALEAARGNKARAARQLGIPRSTLYGLIDRHGL